MPLHILKAFTPRRIREFPATGKLSRRSLLRFSAAAVGTGLLPTLPGCTQMPAFPSFQGRAGPRPDAAERWAMLSDLHLCGNRQLSWGSVNMADHAQAVVDDVLSAGHPPAGVIVNGDCALELGGRGDYGVFRDLVVDPLASAGVPLHVTLGNHDHRHRFVDVLSGALDASRAKEAVLASARVRSTCEAVTDMPDDTNVGGVTTRPAVAHRRASVVAGKHANVFLLDSLDEGHHMAGSIGRAQLRWLDNALTELNDKPAIIVGHHPIRPEGNWFWGNTSLLDGESLYALLDSHPHAKAYFYGHTHRWEATRRGRIHLVNLPTTAYVFDPGQPSGWVDAWVGREGALLQLKRLRPTGPARPTESLTIEWM